MERAPDAAVETKKGRVRSEWLVGQLAESCARLVGGHPSKDEPAQDLYDLMTNEVVATRGFESLDTMKKTERSEEQWSTFFENPTTTMRFAVALRLWRDAHGSAGLPVACIPVSQDTTADAVKLLVTFERGNRETQWRFEQGFWKLIGFDRMMGSAPTKPAATKPKTPLKPRRK